MLTGYEWRMCIKLHKATQKPVAGDSLSTRERNGWIERYCFDLTTLEAYQPRRTSVRPPLRRATRWVSSWRGVPGRERDYDLVPRVHRGAGLFERTSPVNQWCQFTVHPQPHTNKMSCVGALAESRHCIASLLDGRRGDA